MQNCSNDADASTYAVKRVTSPGIGDKGLKSVKHPRATSYLQEANKREAPISGWNVYWGFATTTFREQCAARLNFACRPARPPSLIACSAAIIGRQLTTPHLALLA
jgi:hypothetical protein